MLNYCYLFISELFSNGSDLHKAIELRLQGEGEVTVRAGSAGHWESVQHVLNTVRNTRDIG